MERHQPDWLSLVFGGLFVTLAVVLPVSRWVDWNLAAWVLPLGVLLLGLGIAVTAVTSQRNQSST